MQQRIEILSNMMKLSRMRKKGTRVEGRRNTKSQQKREKSKEEQYRNRKCNFQIVGFLVISNYKYNEYWEIKK